VEIDPTQPVPASREQNQVVGVKAARRHRMIVVDDNAENRDVLVQLFSGLGLDVAAAADGAAGVSEWQRFSPDLIWMDLRMPVMDGYEACRTIHERARESGLPAPKIIAITASSLEESHARFEKAGFIALVGKPFRESDIYSLMQQHLEIEFVYARREVVASSGRVAPEKHDWSEKLGRLEPALRQQLLQAARLADFDSVQQATQRVAAIDPALAKRLQELLENYRFDLIQESLEKSA